MKIRKKYEPQRGKKLYSSDLEQKGTNKEVGIVLNSNHNQEWKVKQ